VYPALTVLQALGREADPVLWVGGEGGMEEELVTRQHIPYTGIPAAGVHGVGLRALPGNLMRLARGTMASRRILREFRPDVVLFTGGYVAVPLAVMAIPRNSLLYVPDIEPGLALKTLARFADQIAVTAPDSRAYFNPNKPVVETGYPIRPELMNWTPEKGRQALGLRDDRPVLMVYGGSKGARSINRALLTGLETLLKQVQIVHLTGTLDWNEVKAAADRLPADLAAQYHPYPYLHEEMGAAFASADLVVCRAGASTLGELPYFGLPAILVPYPYAWRYQRVNADYLVQHQAARVLEDRELADRLTAEILDCFARPEELAQMSQAMQSLARPQAAESIATMLRELAHANPNRRMTTW
jgi:UDP-N-acetylglucosamine--N-acetylmuramyl-(pentapeptide) pyrophosphoryl-undecaprenol N-acetylglucosamine transferase